MATIESTLMILTSILTIVKTVQEWKYGK